MQHMQSVVCRPDQSQPKHTVPGTHDTSDTIIPNRHTLYTYYRTNMNTAQWTVLWPYSNPWITQAYYYPTSNTISNPSTKQEDSFQSRAQTKSTPCSKWPLTPNPLIPHEQVSSASDCIKTPHCHSHTETERQHTPNQVRGSADTILWRHYHNMPHNTLYHHKTPCQPYYWNTLSNTAIHIKTNNSLTNNTLTQYLYTS